MAALQATRVLLAPHDPSVAAALYLRPAATLVEVAPFAYYGGGVAALAGALGVTYRRVVAPPDTPTFQSSSLSFLRCSQRLCSHFSPYCIASRVDTPWPLSPLLRGCSAPAALVSQLVWPPPPRAPPAAPMLTPPRQRLVCLGGPCWLLLLLQLWPPLCR